MSDTFDVVYADPPWRYENGTPGREIERHYPTMTHDELCALAGLASAGLRAQS